MPDLDTKIQMIRDRLAHEVLAAVNGAFASLCGALADDYDQAQQAKALNGEPQARVKC